MTMRVPLDSLLASIGRYGTMTMALDLQAMARDPLTLERSVASRHLVTIPDPVVRGLISSSNVQLHVGLLALAMRLDRPDINGTHIRTATKRYLNGIGYDNRYIADSLRYVRWRGYARMLHSKPAYGRGREH